MPGTYISPAETGLYYLQSRYYDAGVGRFVNGDEALALLDIFNITDCCLKTYCRNNPITNVDPTGFWAEDYSGFCWRERGFNLDVQLYFLSRPFCLLYAAEIIRIGGQWYWWGKGYKKMSALRIAQELWFHALFYYVGFPIKSIFNMIGLSWSWLNNNLERAKYMEINNNDSRAWAFSLVWWAAYTIKTWIRIRLGYGYPFSYIHI